MEEYAIEFKNVSKIYKLNSKDKKKSENMMFYALKNVSFQIPVGEVVGNSGDERVWKVYNGNYIGRNFGN